MMDIEFECGTEAKSVGNIAMACRAHKAECTNAACLADCDDMIEKYS